MCLDFLYVVPRKIWQPCFIDCPPGAVLVEMRREVGDILGFGLNRCSDTGNIYIESIKQVSPGLGWEAPCQILSDNGLEFKIRNKNQSF
jgi:hypothetical protein